MPYQLLKHLTRRLGLEIRRYRPGYSDRCVSLPAAAGVHRGRVLLSYIVASFLEPELVDATHHTRFLESRLIAEAYLQRGFDVDVIDYRHPGFIPRHDYRILVSARTHLASLADRLPATCLKIAHLDTSHYVFNNQAALQRVLALQQRRGFTSSSLRLIEPNRAIERADVAAVLGNRRHTLATYAYAGKPLYTLPVVTAVSLPWVERDYTQARHRFLWMGSRGLVHKGLDVTLEAFCRLPALELSVCGPLDEESEFCQQYARELYQQSNVHALGWVDVASDSFVTLTQRTAAFVYPSCAEGQAGSAILALQAGLIPIVSRETGVDVDDFGIVLEDYHPQTIADAAQYLARLSAAELRQRSRAAWEYAQAHHTPAAYQAAYGQMLAEILPG